MGDDNMKLNWVQVDKDSHRYEATTPRFRFTMVAPPKAKPGLMVQHATSERTDKPIDQRTCQSKWHAQKIAQRFEDKSMSRRLRLPLLVQD
jgi:hypothetical protein